MGLGLVILAGGLGSRFGGVKQLTPVGPNGEVIFDYTASDGVRAGFDTIVLLTRSEIAADLETHVAATWPGSIDIRIALQDRDPMALDAASRGRTKPLGTAHAALVGMRAAGGGACAVVNADDLYGPEAMTLLATCLRDAENVAAALVTFPIQRTVIASEVVKRGLCEVSADGWLERIEEGTYDPGAGEWVGMSGRRVAIGGGEPVSMNLWGLPPSVLAPLEAATAALLSSPAELAAGDEVLLPEVFRSIGGRVAVRSVDAPCIGLTNPGDLEIVRSMVTAAAWG